MNHMERPAAGRTLVAAQLAAVSLLVAACSSDEVATTMTAPPDSTTTSTLPPTTTTAAQTSTTAGPTTTAAVTTTSVVDTNALAEGSGCTPGATTQLSDGEWFGYVDNATADEVDFDLACWFVGEGAALAAAEDGEESPPPNDYYVRNVNPAIRTLAVGSAAAATWMPNPADPTTETTGSYSDWLTGRTGRRFQPGVWLMIEDGEIVDIREQYVP